MTVRRYAVKLRKLVSDVAKLEAGLRAKFDYMNGGRKAWLATVDVQRLDVLTPDAVNAWRNQYVARAGSESGGAEINRAVGRLLSAMRPVAVHA